MKQVLSPSAWVGAVMLGVFIFLGLFGPWLAPYPVGVAAVNQAPQFLPPSWEHWLGTDENGVDALSQLLHGARSALVMSMIVVSLCAMIGVTLGVMAGYFRGVVDEVLMRIVDILMAFPGILLNIAIVATVAEPGVGMVIAALVANGWVGYARVARGQVLSLRERDYVQAARAIGASDGRIMRQHIVPNLLAPIMVQMTFGFGGIILVEASLSFLGLGVTEPTPAWGLMLSGNASDFYREAPWMILFPGLAISAAVFAFNLFGDSLRDWLDPKFKA